MKMQTAPLLRLLNPHCARALEGAAAFSQSRTHTEITVEHWLLVLLEQGDGDITAIAQRYGWDRRSLRQALLGYLNTLPRKVGGKPELSAKLQQLIQQAWLEASGQGNPDAVRSLHLLLTLSAHQTLLVYVAIAPLISLSHLPLAGLLALLDTHSEESPSSPVGMRKGAASLRSLPSDRRLNAARLATLKKFTVDLTAKAKTNLIAPVHGRDEEIKRLTESLSRSDGSSLLIVGKPGVGKTALVEGLALRLVEGKVPDSIKKLSLLRLDAVCLEEKGTAWQTRQRLESVIEAAAGSPETVLLFIDNLQQLMDSANDASTVEILKKALAQRKLRLIAAANTSACGPWFGRGALLEPYFQKIEVAEPDDRIAFEMLYALRARYSNYYGISVQEAALRAAVSLSRRYLPERQLPEKALNVLEQARKRVHMSLHTEPEPLVKIKAELADLAKEQQAIEQSSELSSTTDPARLADISDRNDELYRQLALLQKQYQQERELIFRLLTVRQEPCQKKEYADLQQRLRKVQGCAPLLSLELDVRTVAAAIADWTGQALEHVLQDVQVFSGRLVSNDLNPLFYSSVSQQYLVRRIKKENISGFPEAART